MENKIKDTINIFINGFWDGFIDGTNPVNSRFFLDLFENVFECQILISSDIEKCDLLLESIFGNSILKHKTWKYSFLFSGESRLCENHEKYSCVLWGERNYNNIINLPLFIPYVYCNNTEYSVAMDIPSKNICAILSNSRGKERNLFIEKLEKLIPIDYAGKYKTNVDILHEQYNTPDFSNFVSQYKFIITMENSREDTYITEKIIHGFTSGIIPIYWGSPRICDYFNNERFINVETVDDESVEKVAKKIKFLCENPEEYLKMVNQKVYANDRTIHEIAKDIRNLIFTKPMQTISQIYIVCNPEFEPDRYNNLCDMFYNKMGVSQDNISFISPTYKHTITDDDMNKYVSENIIQNYRIYPMKKSEISLFLNYKAVLESIDRNYKDGSFLIFESDAFIIDENMNKLNDFLNYIESRRNLWDIIHIGYSNEEETFGNPYISGTTPYRNYLLSNEFQTPCIDQTPYIEDITNECDPVRMIRKYHTRCTDSFLWNYNGIIKFLKYMNTETKYNAPFDYYMINKFETDETFKHYWTSLPFFIQGSNHGFVGSTIQNDTS